MTKGNFIEAQQPPNNNPAVTKDIGEMKGLIGSFVDQFSQQQKNAQSSIENKLNKIQEETINEQRYRAETKQELFDLKKLIADQQRLNQDTLWDHSSRSAHFRFDVLRDIKESELPNLKSNTVHKKMNLNVNRQYAQQRPDPEAGVFDDLDR